MLHPFLAYTYTKSVAAVGPNSGLASASTTKPQIKRQTSDLALFITTPGTQLIGPSLPYHGLQLGVGLESAAASIFHSASITITILQQPLVPMDGLASCFCLNQQISGQKSELRSSSLWYNGNQMPGPSTVGATLP